MRVVGQLGKRRRVCVWLAGRQAGDTVECCEVRVRQAARGRGARSAGDGAGPAAAALLAGQGPSQASLKQPDGQMIGAGRETGTSRESEGILSVV